MVKIFIVIGLGYGDEGKGLVTDFLCGESEQPLVVRFNGGQQAGHTVTLPNGTSHVFANFGSGALRGVPTFWSACCCFSPYHFNEEYKELQLHKPVLYIDENCPVTTHYDILFNHALESSRGIDRYGSCGMGVGATFDRSANVKDSLTVGDLFREEILKRKLTEIRAYYKDRFERETIFDFDLFQHDDQDRIFFSEASKVVKSINVTTASKILLERRWQTFIFEGAQGILLDQTFGWSPFITKSNTTTQNAMSLIKSYLEKFTPHLEIFYVTRAYATRHGGGRFSQSAETIVLKNNACETNLSNPYQGNFRTAPLDADRIQYALDADAKFSGNVVKNLVITCLDQLTPTFPVEKFLKKINANFDRIYGSFGPTALTLKTLCS
ncbi:adenylosuccinate synthetase [Mucilaginibacter sp. 21P]|uniref:adenylosuccinate synthetase n=1 Tax=Mucilaginibacter sp. 21P TaxID=2778902 RepID=UPI001C59739D|nr:adenylosuccinate synthetase [Mucilaginibacter sp. 21P]QXV63622.1 adenylosuccinate synthetase [Mucilaginibacter sp. 21P]